MMREIAIAAVLSAASLVSAVPAAFAQTGITLSIGTGAYGTDDDYDYDKGYDPYQDYYYQQQPSYGYYNYSFYQDPSYQDSRYQDPRYRDRRWQERQRRAQLERLREKRARQYNWRHEHRRDRDDDDD